MTRPWNHIPISPSDDPLVELPGTILRLEPHPYFALGAPYGGTLHPWFLRSRVVTKLINAQKFLSEKKFSSYKLGIFDAWRPIRVQEFMVDFVIKDQCLKKGIEFSPLNPTTDYLNVIDEVKQFWAQPSTNPLTPPPHSTGAAVDLTLVTHDQILVDMGGDIDALGDISHPQYYASHRDMQTSSKAILFHSRRNLLRDIMLESGFVQHPKEWWHFSYGDQLWAWESSSPCALYGAYELTDSRP
ncbi:MULTISPECIES: M15 family metallopeptidase [Prochlorococcus]|uniref:M15 family metallopeptidase n=1 Tax=Prochlorococcus TaxID=1218 RepID=UPI0005338BE6|nr:MULTISPECIES: M15 family metallopeptidase [Prochlorococcus]KGG12338.1 D-ala-D-ala dipeptidase [Prochlorococcus sp. MIT 0601]